MALPHHAKYKTTGTADPVSTFRAIPFNVDATTSLEALRNEDPIAPEVAAFIAYHPTKKYPNLFEALRYAADPTDHWSHTTWTWIGGIENEVIPDESASCGVFNAVPNAALRYMFTHTSSIEVEVTLDAAGPLPIITVPGYFDYDVRPAEVVKTFTIRGHDQKCAVDGWLSSVP